MPRTSEPLFYNSFEILTVNLSYFDLNVGCLLYAATNAASSFSVMLSPLCSHQCCIQLPGDDAASHVRDAVSRAGVMSLSPETGLLWVELVLCLSPCLSVSTAAVRGVILINFLRGRLATGWRLEQVGARIFIGWRLLQIKMYTFS